MIDARFIRPIAHRGLHDKGRGIEENSTAAFRTAIERGHGIECDLQPAADGTPMVFHDFDLARLTGLAGRIRNRSLTELKGMRYPVGGGELLTLGELLALVGGRVPLLVEIKSDWQRPADGFLETIAGQCRTYAGPLALMSFDPGVVRRMAMMAPGIPRGMVAGNYDPPDGAPWHADQLSAERRYRLTHLLESRDLEMSFVNYDVAALPTPVTRYLREVAGLALFAWTVRTAEGLAAQRTWADAPVYESIAID